MDLGQNCGPQVPGPRDQVLGTRSYHKNLIIILFFLNGNPVLNRFIASFSLKPGFRFKHACAREKHRRATLCATLYGMSYTMPYNVDLRVKVLQRKHQQIVRLIFRLMGISTGVLMLLLLTASTHKVVMFGLAVLVGLSSQLHACGE